MPLDACAVHVPPFTSHLIGAAPKAIQAVHNECVEPPNSIAMTSYVITIWLS